MRKFIHMADSLVKAVAQNTFYEQSTFFDIKFNIRIFLALGIDKRAKERSEKEVEG